MARMRLRQRAPRALGEDWVLPRRSGRSTTLGNLDSSWRASVDPAGLVTVDGASWSLDWWIGAEDRWHLPCREVAVRQSLVGSSPVVETRVRVPGGDAVQRAYAARSASGEEWLVIEIENQTSVPFAVALAVRPHGQDAIGGIDSIALDGTTLRVDGRAALRLPKRPGRVAMSDAAGGDCAATVLAGRASDVGPASITCREGLAQAALLFPLAHTATLRVAVPLPPHSTDAPAAQLGDLPTSAQVASGWMHHAASAARLEVPDRRLRDAFAASTRHLLLGQAAPSVAAAVDLLGFHAAARRLLLTDPAGAARTDAPGAFLHAVARHWELTRDLSYARAAVDVVGALVSRVARAHDGADRALGVGALAGAAGLLEAAGETRAVVDVTEVARRLGVPGSDMPGEAVASASELAVLLAGASSTWTWPGPHGGHDLTANAALVELVRGLLVRDELAGLALSPAVPDGWLGQGWELHDAPTRHGRLSYAVRWHGERPALLWQLEPHPEPAPVTLTIPGLDPAWSTTAATGEALLAPVAIPDRAPRRGLTLPVAIEPVPRRRS